MLQCFIRQRNVLKCGEEKMKVFHSKTALVLGGLSSATIRYLNECRVAHAVS